MFRLLADENFDYDVLRGVLQRFPELDVVTVADEGLLGAVDQMILERAASWDRIVFTHDRQTMPGYAFDRVRAGLPMPGLVVVSKRASVGAAVHALQLFLECSSHDEWKDQVVFLPYA